MAKKGEKDANTPTSITGITGPVGCSKSCRRTRGVSRRRRRTWSGGSWRRISVRSWQNGVFGWWSR